MTGERGLPVHIYRPGRITGPTTNGAMNTEDFTSRLLKGCIQLHAAPILPHARLDFSPVDTVADVIVRCILRGSYDVYHVFNTCSVSWHEVVESIRAFQYPMELLPFDEWLLRLREEQTGNVRSFSRTLHT